MDDAGQSALFDAFLFFIVALVASAAALGYAALSFANDETVARNEAISYAEDVRVALMRTTLDDPWYLDADGARVDLGQAVTIETFLLAEIRLISAGLPPENFEHANAAVRDVAGSLIRTPFSGGLFATLVGTGAPTNLWIGPGAGPPSERYTSAWTYTTPDGPTTIAVHLWLV